LLPLLADDAGELPLALAAVLGGGRQKQRPDGVLAQLGQGEAEFLGLAGQELVRRLGEDAGPVAGVLLAAPRAPVPQGEQDRQTFTNDVVGLAAPEVRDEADAAGVVLERGVVESLLRGRKPVLVHDSFLRDGRGDSGACPLRSGAVSAASGKVADSPPVRR